MMHVSDIDSLTNFKRHTPQFTRRMARTKRPMALTVNGKAEWVLMNRQIFEAYENKMEYLDMLQAIDEGLADVKAGRTVPAEQVFAELRRKFNIQD